MERTIARTVVPVAERLLDDLPTGSSGRPYHENPHLLPISVSSKALAVKECSGARERRVSAQRRRRFPDAAVDQLLGSACYLPLAIVSLPAAAKVPLRGRFETMP